MHEYSCMLYALEYFDYECIGLFKSTRKLISKYPYTCSTVIWHEYDLYRRECSIFELIVRIVLEKYIVYSLNTIRGINVDLGVY